MLPLPDCSARTQSPSTQRQDYNRFRRQHVLYYTGSLPPNYKCFAKNNPGLFSFQLQAPYNAMVGLEMVKCTTVPILFKCCCPLCLSPIPTATPQQEERNPQDTLRLDGQPDVAYGHGNNLHSALAQAGRCLGLGEREAASPTWL